MPRSLVRCRNRQKERSSRLADRLRDDGYDIHLNPRGAAARQFVVRERTVVILH
jgi:hypothetical protein